MTCASCGRLRCDGVDCYLDPIEDGLCEGCGGPLAGGGLCLICTNLARNGELGLTEVHGDPLLKRRAA